MNGGVNSRVNSGDNSRMNSGTGAGLDSGVSSGVPSQVEARVHARGVQLSLAIPGGHTLALVGPNGAGKSSVLDLLAGLLVADEGRVVVAGRTVSEVDPVRGVREVVPPHRRRVALLAQDPLLFPHLDVRDNVAFGPRSAGLSRTRARAAAQRWLAEVGAADLADSRPRDLSGGQAQRVALARALAAEPELLLLDEPMGSLDVAVAASVRQVLRRLLAGRSVVLVTHDVLDVALLAASVAVLDGGRVVEQGDVLDVLRAPRTPFAARLFGLNLLRGTATAAERLTTPGGREVHGTPGEQGLRPGEDAVAVFAPAAVGVFRTLPTGSPRNVFIGKVTELEPRDHLVRVRVGEIAADITPASVADLRLTPGETVHLAVKAAEVALHPAGRT